MAQQLRRGVGGGRRPLARAVAACCAAAALGCLMWSVAHLLRNAVQLGSVSSAGFFAGLRSGGCHHHAKRCHLRHAGSPITDVEKPSGAHDRSIRALYEESEPWLATGCC